MKIQQLPTTHEGTFAGVFTLPWPWPPATPVNLLNRKLPDGSLHIAIDPTGRIRVALLSHDKLTDTVLLSCPLRTDAPAAVACCIVWVCPTLEIYINNVLIGSLKSEEHLPNEYIVPPREQLQPQYDFSGENSVAQGQRRQTLAGSLGSLPRGGRLYGGKDYMFDRLQDEIKQLSDLLDLVRKGSTHHAIGLAARLRLLIITGKPLPLLQWCAASIDHPLIVFTAHNPRAKMLPIPPPHDFLRLNGSSTPTFLLENPVDLDVWLDLETAQMDKVWVTNRELLKKIGDTRGAHVAVEIEPFVDVLHSSSSDISAGGQSDFFVQYVSAVASMVLDVAVKLRTNALEPDGLPPCELLSHEPSEAAVRTGQLGSGTGGR